jgi:LmbE family N-acetylglucosaminyl deacetylase
VTDGRGSRALGLDANAMAVRRRAEAAASVGIAGVSRWEWLGLPEGAWADADLARSLATFVRDLAPQVIYVPSRVDFHPEHRRVARVLARSSYLVEQAQIVLRIYQVQVPLTGILVNLVAPMSAVLSRARRACDAYSSQAESLRAPFRLKGYAGVTYGLGAAAEEFWEISPGAYARLHGQESRESTVEHFRGLRRLSMTDPLAFVEGRAERLRLRSLSEVNPSRG